jgi:hypothetical protein
MSEIPDWLRELATESDQEEFPEGGLSGDAEDTPVPDDSNASAESPSAVEVTPSSASEETRTQSSDSEGDLDLMEQLRNQVDSEEEESEPSSPALSFSLDNVIIEGLEPVQQFVLAVLLFLDVLVIGLLFLVMLGRIAI